jgi:hypothetical protein
MRADLLGTSAVFGAWPVNRARGTFHPDLCALIGLNRMAE